MYKMINDSNQIDSSYRQAGEKSLTKEQERRARKTYNIQASTAPSSTAKASNSSPFAAISSAQAYK